MPDEIERDRATSGTAKGQRQCGTGVAALRQAPRRRPAADVFQHAAFEFVAGGSVVGLGERATGEVALQFRHLVTVDGGVDGLRGGVGGLAAQAAASTGRRGRGSESPAAIRKRSCFVFGGWRVLIGEGFQQQPGRRRTGRSGATRPARRRR